MTYNKIPIHHFSKDIKKFLTAGNTRGVIYGNFGACNAGDEAILAGELIELQKLVTTKVSVVSRYPEKVKKIHKVEALPLQNFFMLLRTLIFSDYVIIGGGGLFCKNDAGIKGILFQLYTSIMFLFLPFILRKKIFAIGLGFYKNTNIFTAKIARLGLSLCNLIAVRDVASYTYLRSKKLPVLLYKDNSFLMPVTSSSYEKYIGKVSKYYIVGIALNAPHKTNDRERLAKEVAVFMEEHSHSTHFIIYSLDYHPSYLNDRKFFKKIGRQLSENVSLSFFPTNVSPQDLFSSFASTDFMITSRLHASIFSYRVGVPFYSVSYDLKCESFLNSIGHQYTYPSSVTAIDISRYFQAAKIKKKEYAALHNNSESEGVNA